MICKFFFYAVTVGVTLDWEILSVDLECGKHKRGANAKWIAGKIIL